MPRLSQNVKRCIRFAVGWVAGFTVVYPGIKYLAKQPVEPDWLKRRKKRFRERLEAPDAQLASSILCDHAIEERVDLGPAWTEITGGSKTRVMDVDHHVHSFLYGRPPDEACPRDDSTSCWMCAHGLYGRDIDLPDLGDPQHTIYPAHYKTGLLLYALYPGYFPNAPYYREELAVEYLLNDYFDIINQAVINGISSEYILESPRVSDSLARVRMPVRVRTKNANDKIDEPAPKYGENVFMIYDLWDTFLSQKKGIQKLLDEYVQNPTHQYAYPPAKDELFEKPPEPRDDLWTRRFVKEELPTKNGVRAFVIDRAQEGPVVEEPGSEASIKWVKERAMAMK